MWLMWCRWCVCIDDCVDCWVMWVWCGLIFWMMWWDVMFRRIRKESRLIKIDEKIVLINVCLNWCFWDICFFLKFFLLFLFWLLWRVFVKFLIWCEERCREINRRRRFFWRCRVLRLLCFWWEFWCFYDFVFWFVWF